MNHHNIATVFAIDEAEDQMFIAMEFVEGKSLQEMISENGGSPLSIDDAINYATQIADARQRSRRLLAISGLLKAK